MEDLNARRHAYMQCMDQVNQAAMKKNRKSPREIIAVGIEKSTGISDTETVNRLADKVLADEIKEQEANHDVFLFSIAESLENIRCETTSENEYFSWIDGAKKIMEHLTDGYVSFKDIHEKDAFIKMSWQRETELLTCLGLYEKSNHPLAKERYAVLKIKLQRLRQIRSALLTGTKNSPDWLHLSPEEKARLRGYVKVLDDMKANDADGDYHNMGLMQRMQELQMSHMYDVEFCYAGYCFYQRMLEDQRRAEAEFEDLAAENLYLCLRRPDEYLDIMRHKGDSKENIARRIQELTGRRTASHYNLRMQDSQKTRQTFDVHRYRQLMNEKDRLS